MTQYNFAVVGAGIAGASFAAHVAARGASVLILERESSSGYHSTGRSAALFSALYGNQTIQSLTRASRAFFESPPPGFAEHPLLIPRGVLYVAEKSEQAALERILCSPLAQSISIQEAMTRVPILREDAFSYAALESGACDIDVHALHRGFLRMAKAAGAIVLADADVQSLERRANWHITTNKGSVEAEVVVNAAGAWAQETAHMAGASSIELQPLRRTAINIVPSANFDVSHWPGVFAANESFYFKPDAGKLLASPADETPSVPCDAQPEELDIAICVDLIEKATTLSISHVAHAWAGLRTFTSDRAPVVGYDPECAGFFWLAGQGGYGIQTAPALSEVAAAIALGRPIPTPILAEDFSLAALTPARFRRTLTDGDRVPHGSALT
jgi:D-arginine dehydrogenase